VRQVIAIVAVAVAVYFAVDMLADATQNRPDAPVAGSTSVVEFSVSTRDFQRGEGAAASALWTVCAATVPGDVSAQPEPVGDHWQVTVSPAIGKHGEKRLVGCLEDVTIDRVVGNVVAIRDAA
jgi:hypothetical protein